MMKTRSKFMFNLFTFFALLASLLGGALSIYAMGAILVNSDLDTVTDDDTSTILCFFALN